MTILEGMQRQINLAERVGVAATHWAMGQDYRAQILEPLKKELLPTVLGNTCYGLPVVVTNAIPRDTIALMRGTNGIGCFYID